MFKLVLYIIATTKSRVSQDVARVKVNFKTIVTIYKYRRTTVLYQKNQAVKELNSGPEDPRSE